MKFVKTILVLIFLSNTYSAQQIYIGQSIEDILKLPEKNINVGIATLVLAKEFYPNLNIQFFLQTFDYLADRYKFHFGKYNNPEDQIRALNSYLYKPGFWNDSITFTYDDDDLQVTKLDNKFINGYIANKKGSCITMPMLYVILGERLGFPIYPVRSAKHFFVRYTPGKSSIKFQQNIEATNGGGFISDNQYKEDVLIPDKAIKNGVYLRTLSKKEYIASLLLINTNEYIKQKNIEKAKHYFQLAIKYDSTFSSAYWNYGLTVFGEARQLEEILWEEKQNIISLHSTITDLANKNNSEVINQSRQTTQNELKELIPPIPQPSSFQILDKSQLPNNNANLLKKNNYASSRTLYQAELQNELQAIEKKYEPLILEKIKIYKEYTQKAEQLGIVHKFPIEFFEKQIESVKKFKQKGGY